MGLVTGAGACGLQEKGVGSKLKLEVSNRSLDDLKFGAIGAEIRSGVDIKMVGVCIEVDVGLTWGQGLVDLTVGLYT